MITSSATGTSTKVWEFVKNYYLTNAFHPKNVVVVNERAFQRLSDAREESARSTRRRPPRSAAGSFRAQREQNANKALADNGMSVHRARRRDEAAFARIGETMLAEWQKTAGADGEALIKAYRSR